MTMQRIAISVSGGLVKWKAVGPVTKMYSEDLFSPDCYQYPSTSGPDKGKSLN